MSISGRMPSIAVEYDRYGSRVTKQFTNAFKARSFYATKLKEGKNPKVKGAMA